MSNKFQSRTRDLQSKMNKMRPWKFVRKYNMFNKIEPKIESFLSIGSKYNNRNFKFHFIQSNHYTWFYYRFSLCNLQIWV